MKNKTNFIVTMDKETADKLISEGFKLIAESNSKFTFENKPIENFTKQDENSKKMAYTNILTF